MKSDECILKTYNDQTVVEQHFAFMEDPKVGDPVYMKNEGRGTGLRVSYCCSFGLQRTAAGVRQAMHSETEPLILVGKV